MPSPITTPTAPTTASSTTTSAQIVIEGIKLSQWKNTHWNGDVVPLKVCQDDIPGYEGYRAVKVYEKVLGRLAKSNPLPHTQFYAYLITDNNCVLAIIIDKEKEPQSQIKGYSRPQWELDLIKIARDLSINTELQRRSLQIARVWDYTFIYSRETETIYLMSTREKRGKLYQAKRGQPAKVCNLNLEDLAFFSKQKRKIEYQRKWKENSPESESKNLSFFKATAIDEFTEDCLRKLKYYEQEHLSSLLNYGEFEYEFQPHYLREWLKRNDVSENEAITEKQLKENINDYVFFLYWLIEQKKLDLIELMVNGEFIEDYYGDAEVEEYKAYRRENAEIVKAEESLSNWEWTMQEEEEFEKEHGWMEDGEYQLMRYLEGLDEVPEFEKSKVGNEEIWVQIEQTPLNTPCIVVSYSDDEITNYEVQQVWNQYAEKAGLKAEEHIKVLVEQKKGYYPQRHRIEVSPSLLQAAGDNPINFILDREF